MDSFRRKQLRLSLAPLKVVGFFLVAMLYQTLLTGCVSRAPTPTLDQRIALANSLSQKAGFVERLYQSPPFTLKAYERFTEADEPLVVYIEGDGHAWERYGPSDNPTPINPLALRLSLADQSKNVLYLARPCQYTITTCSVKYWTSHRMANEVIDAYEALIYRLMSQRDISALRLVGFSGGGGVAALLVDRLSHRINVLDFRSLAGNLDHRAWTKELALIPMNGSLNSADIASDISHIPQLHFVGKNDRVVSRYISSSYLKKSGNTKCIQISAQNASHVRGWVELWPRLHQLTAECKH